MRYLKNKWVFGGLIVLATLAVVWAYKKYWKSPVSDKNPNGADTAAAPPPNAQTNAPKSLAGAVTFAQN